MSSLAVPIFAMSFSQNLFPHTKKGVKKLLNLLTLTLMSMVKYYRSVTTNIDSEIHDLFKQTCKKQDTTMNKVLKKTIMEFIRENVKDESRNASQTDLESVRDANASPKPLRLLRIREQSVENDIDTDEGETR